MPGVQGDPGKKRKKALIIIKDDRLIGSILVECL